MNTTRTAKDMMIATIRESLRDAHRQAAEASRVGTYTAALRRIEALEAEIRDLG